jgi:hypothetical protein
VSNVFGASGALPIETACKLVRSAVAKSGCATSNSAMAGTRNAIVGRSRSTIRSHSPASNFGWYNPTMPIFIGL